ncbi:amino acid permease [Amycolatopsis mongoliensis]|uniref:Amino acid permease n=1 Tax=Amycolatopsis mongoliensis TaxID=715475 RepID=A0A9Y2JIX3_9PSEU|nr:amino acid permease [Amycolatopsis sp. 4-36]WIX98133.1 amino acid permease [Amycolatopsis sp. 4-36]
MAEQEHPGLADEATSDGPSPARGHEFVSRFGLPTATALVVGAVIGTGVFALPSSPAPYGMSSLLAFAPVTLGALTLALVFGWLTRRAPGSGGPYLYARDAFGDFVAAWSPWAATPCCAAANARTRTCSR